MRKSLALKIPALPDDIRIEGVRVSLGQNNDSCDEGNLGQEMIITINDAGGGKYPVIETSRWAFDEGEIEWFAQTLKALCAFGSEGSEE